MYLFLVLTSEYWIWFQYKTSNTRVSALVCPTLHLHIKKRCTNFKNWKYPHFGYLNDHWEFTRPSRSVSTVSCTAFSISGGLEGAARTKGNKTFVLKPLQYSNYEVRATFSKPLSVKKKGFGIELGVFNVKVDNVFKHLSV